MIRLFVGLGNPGPDYEATRHNAGFWWLDAIAGDCKAALAMDKSHQGLLARATVEGHTVWLLKPQTFMNHSGRSVASLARFYKIAPEEILVAYDELDLLPGQARLKFGTNRGTHNGLRDLYDQLGSGDYWRLRLGIGHPGIKSEVANWVLKKPSLDHKIAVEQAVDRSRSAFTHLVHGEMDKATLLIHTDKPPRPNPARPTPAPGAASLPNPPSDPS
jgi:peptidyl-tRNA hydrolase, PTH1 family